MEEIIIEIRDAEGGEDAKLLVKDMADIYLKWSNINNIGSKILESKEGFVSIWLKGKNIKSIFNNEVGTHCWHRVPPTEKRGRVHSSTIAVSVIDKETFRPSSIEVNPKDVERKYTCSGGKGGQNVNRRSTCVILIHKPTGIIVRSEENRTQGKNEVAAWERLRKILQEGVNKDSESSLRNSRYNPNSAPIKRRTYKVKDCIVIDHISGKKDNLTKILKGNINALHA